MPGVDAAEHDMLRQTIRQIIAREATADAIAEWDRTKDYPQQFFATLAESGLIALPFPADLGGQEGGPVEMAIVGEELGRASIDLAGGYGITVFAGLNLARFGTDEQLTEQLSPVLDGRRRFAIGYSEPEAGSDAAAIQTRARREGDELVIHGQKLWSTGAGLPNTTLHVSVRTDDDGQDGVAVVLVPNDAPGVEMRRLDMVGRHMVGTYEIFFEDVRVPAANLIGETGTGWEVITSGLQVERLFGASSYIGGAQAALDLAIEYARTRRQFGRAIGSFQAIAHRLADLHARVQAGRTLTYSAVERLARGASSKADAAAAKLYASEIFQEACDAGMQVMGAYGYTREYPMERFWRDARSTTVAAGTSEIQRTIIAKSLGLR